MRYHRMGEYERFKGCSYFLWMVWVAYSMPFPLVSILWILEVIGVSLMSEFLPLKLLRNGYHSYSILATQQTGQFSFQLRQLIQN